ncbi:MAG: DUF4340 domain-containing protein [Planctomycetota bacterium]|nr:DUF4340 domain-containing protein [Planctomycetota bacterium]
MSWRTLAVLVVAVAALAFFALRTAKREEQSLARQDAALFPGLDANLVSALRIENVQRDLHMRFERDPKGAWRITDPVASRAEDGPLELILQGAVRARGTPVPAEEAGDLAKIGLDPPRFVLDIETGVGDARKRQRAEFGAVELDGTRIFARAGGQVLRVVRELEPLLDLQLHELRASSISDVDPRTVLEFRRTGSFQPVGSGPGVDLALEAVQEGGAWRATAPVTGLLDPGAMALYVQSTVAYRYESVFDEGSRTLKSLGLDPPEMALRFGTIDTEVVEILLGRAGTQREGGWLGTRTGSSIVWPISAEDVKFLAIPVEDLLDHKLVRARRSAIQRLEIGSSLGEVHLVRGAKGWTCASARAGSSVFGPAESAETRFVEDVLGELERYELTGFPRGVAFDPGPSPVRWRVVSEDGEAAGTFGGSFTDSGGARDVLFQRSGETAVAHGDPAIVSRLMRDPEQLLALRLLETSESDLSGLTVRGAAGERRFARNAKGIWTRQGGEVEARELRNVLESLLFVRVSERLPEVARGMLEEPIQVELEAQGAIRSRLVVGLVAHGASRRAEVEVEGRRGVLLDARLHEKLTALLAGP